MFCLSFYTFYIIGIFNNEKINKNYEPNSIQGKIFAVNTAIYLYKYVIYKEFLKSDERTLKPQWKKNPTKMLNGQRHE